MKKIGVVILNYVTWQETQKCIASIQSSRGIESIKIYVVDNASPNYKELESICHGKNVCLIHNEENTGYAAGNNVGILHALEDGCEYVLISNNDVSFETDSIYIMQQYLEMHPEYGIVAPRIVDNNKKNQCCHFIKKIGYGDIWTTQTVFRFVCHKATDRIYGSEEFYQIQQDIFAAAGCCFMMSAECAGRVTPLDETTFLYEEENILGIRMEQQGYKTRYLPQSRVIHGHDQTTRLVKPFALICWACSEIYYLAEYLHISRWKIYFLYYYRTLIFLLHGIKNPEYRKQWKNYINKTKNYLNIYGNNRKL